MTEKNTKPELLKEYKRLCAETVSRKVALPDVAHGITAKNVKLDILRAIHALEEMLQKEKENPSSAVDSCEEQEKPVQEVAAQNDCAYYDLSSARPAETAEPEKDNRNEGDNDLRYLNQEIIEKIEALETAKALKKAEYADILRVEEQLLRFVEMINQKKAAGLALAEEQQVKGDAQKKQIEEMRTQAAEQWETELKNAVQELEDLKESIVERSRKLAEERAVEEEAYQYKISEEEKKSDDAWNDTVAHAEESLAEVEKSIRITQEEIQAKDAYKKELEAKMAALPELLKKAEEEGAAAKEKELGKEYGYKSSKSKKESENAIQALQEEIELLRKDFEDVVAEKQSIQAKLDKAYEENNKLYMQTVQSTGGVKILHNSDKS